MSVPEIYYKREKPARRRFPIFLDGADANTTASNGQSFSWTWTVTIPKPLTRARLYLDAAHFDVQTVGGNGNCGVSIRCDGINVVDTFGSTQGRSRHLGFLTLFGSNHIQYGRTCDKYLEVSNVPTNFQFTISVQQSENDTIALNKAEFELVLVEEDYE